MAPKKGAIQTTGNSNSQPVGDTANAPPAASAPVLHVVEVSGTANVPGSDSQPAGNAASEPARELSTAEKIAALEASGRKTAGRWPWTDVAAGVVDRHYRRHVLGQGERLDRPQGMAGALLDELEPHIRAIARDEVRKTIERATIAIDGD